MADRERPDASAWRDRRQRLKHEIPPGEVRVRNGQSARPELAPAPKGNVEIEHARAPSAAPPAAKFTFHKFQAAEHLEWFQAAFHDRHSVRKISARTAVRGVDHD